MLTIDNNRHKMTAMMKIKQKTIAQILNRDPSEICRLLSGKRQVSWPLAVTLSELMPGRTIEQWKRSTPAELERSFLWIEQSQSQIKETA